MQGYKPYLQPLDDVPQSEHKALLKIRAILVELLLEVLRAFAAFGQGQDELRQGLLSQARVILDFCMRCIASSGDFSTNPI